MFLLAVLENMEPGQTALEDQLVVTTAVVTVVLLTAVLVEECHIFPPQTIPQQQAGTLMGHFWLPAAVAEQTTLGEAAGPMMDAVEMAVERMVKMHTLKT